MSDAGNIKIYQGVGLPSIVLYTHNRGSEIYGIVKRVLSRQERWSDSPYLARMIFNELTKGDELGSTGFGIQTYVGTNDHTVIGINCETYKVTFETADGDVKSSVSFDELVSRKDKWSASAGVFQRG